MSTRKLKMLALIAGSSTMLAKPGSQRLPESPKTIYLATNSAIDLSYPECRCQHGPLCDSCRESSLQISCEGCHGPYFEENPAERKIKLDGSWSPEGIEFQIELKIIGQEETLTHKATVIRLPPDCDFPDFIQKSLTKAPNWSINYDFETHLSEVVLGPFPDQNCGKLDFSIQGKCFSISSKSDYHATLEWEPQKDDCKENNNSFLTIFLQKRPRVHLEIEVQDLLFNKPGQTLPTSFEIAKIKLKQEVSKAFAQSRNLNHVGSDCATSVTVVNKVTNEFTYRDCSGPFTYTPLLVVNPPSCIPAITYVDWDSVGNDCGSSSPDQNVVTKACCSVPVISSVNSCGWMSVPQVGDSSELNINSCSIAGHPLKTAKSAQIRVYSIDYIFRAGGASEFIHSLKFKVTPHCADYTTMIAPTLPPQNFDFQAGKILYPKGYIPAFYDTASMPLQTYCGTRTCSSDSAYAVWQEADQKFAIGSTGYGSSTRDVPGVHQITLTCGLTNYPSVEQVSSSFSLTISSSCYTATLILPVVQANYDVFHTITTSVTIPKWQDTYSVSNGDATGSNLCSTQFCTTNSIYAVFSLSNQWVEIKAVANNQETGVFPVTIECYQYYYPTIPKRSVSFTVTVKPCVFSSVVATTRMSGTAAPLVQTVLGPSLNWRIDTIISTAPLNCQYTFTYHVQLRDGSTDFTPFGGTLSAASPPVLTVYATSDAAKGTYNLQWYATSVNNPDQARVYVDFTVQINDCIVLSTTGASYVAQTRAQNIFAPVFSAALNLRTQVPACGYGVVYSCTVNEVGTSAWSTAPWCATTAANLDIQTNNYLLDGKSYLVKQTAKIGLIYTESTTAPLTVNFADPCKTSTFISQNVPNQLYFITSEGLTSLTFTFPLLDDTANQLYGSQNTESICYKSTTVITDAGATPKYAIISQKLDGSTEVKIATSDTTLAGPHTLQASYTFQRYPLIAAKLISATIKFYQLVSPKSIDKSYQIKDKVLNFTVDAFSTLPISQTLQCVQKVTLSNGRLLPSIFTVVKTDTQFQFLVYSTDSSDEGTYTIKIAAKFSEDDNIYETSTTFKVVLTGAQTITPKNQPPEFDDSLAQTFNLKVGEDWSYTLPTYSDPEGQNVTLSVDLDRAGMFIVYQNGKCFIFTPTTSFNLGTYPIKLKLTDAKGLSKNYSFDVVVLEAAFANNTQVEVQSDLSNEQLLAALDSTPEWNWLDQYLQAKERGKTSTNPVPPTVKFSKLSILGEVELSFSKQMVTPPQKIFKTVAEPASTKHRSLLGNRYKTPAITLLSTKGDPADPTNLNFTYSIVSYNNKTMKIQIDFARASDVSQNFYQDIFSVIFNGNYMFFDMEGLFISKYTTITYQLPSQLQYNTTETKMVVQATEIMQQTSTIVMSSNLVVNLLLSAALNQLFSMVRILQIITLLPLFSIRMPGNAALFFCFLLQIASFDIVPMHYIYDQVFPDQQASAAVLNPNFAQLGITSTLFLYNVGSLILAFVAVPVLLLAYPLLIPCKRFNRVQKIRHKIWTSIFFNETLKTMTESFVILVVCVCINTLDLGWTRPEQYVNSVLTVCFGAALIVFPFLACIFVYKNFGKLEETKIQECYGSFYENLELRRGRGIIWQIGFFFLRRILIPVVVVYQDALICQVMTISYSAVAQVIIVGSVKPFQGGNKVNNMEVFSEVILMMILYTMMLFTDFAPDLEIRPYIGYVSIAFVAIHLIVCFGIMIIDTLRRTSNRIKWYVIRRKNIKIQQEIKAIFAIKMIKPATYRMEIVQEVNPEFEESSHSERSRRKSARSHRSRSRSESSLNSRQSMLRPAPPGFELDEEFANVAPVDDTQINFDSASKLQNDLYEADLLQIEKEAEAKKAEEQKSILEDSLAIDIEKQAEKQFKLSLVLDKIKKMKLTKQSRNK